MANHPALAARLGRSPGLRLPALLGLLGVGLVVAMWVLETTVGPTAVVQAFVAGG